MDSKNIAQSLTAHTGEMRQRAENDFSSLSLEQLRFQPAPDKWSILECLEHLNCYSRYYLPLLEKGVEKGKKRGPKPFKSGWMGKKFTAMVSPENIKPAKTLSRMNPSRSTLTQECLEEFLRHQAHLLRISEAAASADLNPRVIPVEFLKLIRLKTGDALLFMQAHQSRHIIQATRLLPEKQ